MPDDLGSASIPSLETRVADLENGIVALTSGIQTLLQRSAAPAPAVSAVTETAAEDPGNPADIVHPPIGGAPHDDGSPPTGLDRLAAIESRIVAWEPAILEIIRVAGTVVPGGLGQMLSQLAAQFGHAKP